MNWNDMICKSCASYAGQIFAGTCSHIEQSPYSDYPWETCGGCCHWWNNGLCIEHLTSCVLISITTGPAIGNDGRYCVCYKTADMV
jgi:hypothetical protein